MVDFLLSIVGLASLGGAIFTFYRLDRKSTRLNSSHVEISYAVFCLKKKTLFFFFIGMVIFVMRPGSTNTYRDVADIPFRHEDKPAAAGDAPARAGDAKESLRHRKTS